MSLYGYLAKPNFDKTEGHGSCVFQDCFEGHFMQKISVVEGKQVIKTKFLKTTLISVAFIMKAEEHSELHILKVSSISAVCEHFQGKTPDQMFSSFFLEDKESMIQVLRAVDKANGYCFGDLEERNLQAMMSAAVGADFQFNSYPSQITALTHCDSFASR